MTGIRILTFWIGVAGFAAECRTPQGTLCRTIRYEYFNWRNQSWGLHDVARSEGSGVLAYRSDGAKYEMYSARSYTHYVVPEYEGENGLIVLPQKQQTIVLFPLEKTFRRLRKQIGGWPTWHREDTNCSKRQQTSNPPDGTERFLGIDTVRYARRTSREILTVWLAPQLGCLEMRQTSVEVNRFGLPTAYFRREVTSVKLGEPDAALFEPPASYRDNGAR